MWGEAPRPLTPHPHSNLQPAPPLNNVGQIGIYFIALSVNKGRVNLIPLQKLGSYKYVPIATSPQVTWPVLQYCSGCHGGEHVMTVVWDVVINTLKCSGNCTYRLLEH